MTQPERIDVNPGLVPPIAPTRPGATPAEPARTADGRTFNDILRTKVRETVPTEHGQPASAPVDRESTIRWSAHATARLRQRGIELTEGQHVRLENAVDRAQTKGSKDALVLLDNAAMVVSVKNRTVITALHRDQAKDNVFTNIDAAVIA